MRYLLVALTVLLLPSLASSQDRRREPDALLLARICAHEAGWEARGECAAIYDVLLRVAERHGMTFRGAAYAYSGRALRGSTNRAWVSQLDEAGTAPSSWPTIRTVCRRAGEPCSVERHAPWVSYRRPWLDLLDHARSIVRGDVASPCASRPDDWGGAMDRDRASRIGLVEVDCGETRNDFYVRPSTLREQYGPE